MSPLTPMQSSPAPDQRVTGRLAGGMTLALSEVRCRHARKFGGQQDRVIETGGADALNQGEGANGRIVARLGAVSPHLLEPAAATSILCRDSSRDRLWVAEKKSRGFGRAVILTMC